MSYSLYWSPIVQHKTLPFALRKALESRYGDLGFRERLTRRDMDYITGLAHGGVEGAQELLDALDHHDVVEVWTAQ